MNREMRRSKKWPFMAPPNSVTGKIVEAIDNIEKLDSDEKDRIVRELDMSAAAKVFPMMNDDAIEPMLLKVRYEMTNMPDELRHESRRWLQANGFKRMREQSWPPEGELPE